MPLRTSGQIGGHVPMLSIIGWILFDLSQKKRNFGTLKH